MKAYKGFDKDLKCRDFQFEIGKEYEEENASLCNCGFHACEAPLDVFNYYSPADSRFCEVELDEVSDEKSNDSKRVGKKIKIGAEIGIKDLINAFAKFIFEKAEPTTGYAAHSATTGYAAHSATTGKYAHSATTGYAAHSATTGYAANSATTGYAAHSATTGYAAHSATTGKYANSATTGKYANSATTGDAAHSATTGYAANSATTGKYAHSATTGKYAHSATTGKYANSATTGDAAHSAVGGANSVAISTGKNSFVKGSLGCGIVCAERGEWDGEGYPLISIKAAIVDGETIKPDTWYTLKNGEFVEVKDEA